MIISMVREPLARELMKKPVKRVWADTPLREAADFLRRHRISGLLVVDDRGRPIGVFTLSDLAEHVRRRFLAGAIDAGTVGEVMSPRIVMVKPTATVRQIARLMADRGHHRIFVEERGEASGVITSMDLLRWVGRSAEPRKPTKR